MPLQGVEGRIGELALVFNLRKYHLKLPKKQRTT